jgi:hypothetical protein
MNLSSPKINFDHRLLAIEEQFRQRKYQHSVRELRHCLLTAASLKVIIKER